jgi:hypothetical protein
VINSSFPINDGGLFYSMTRELVSNGYKIPQFTNYNHLQIPFAYPPLGFVLAGGISGITRWELVDIFRILPAVFSVLTIPAFYLLAKATIKDDFAVGLSVLAYSFIPTTTAWFIMGGGITRAPGYFFSLLALHRSYLCFTRNKRADLVLAALFSTLAVLFHPEAAAHTAVGIFVFLMIKGRNKRGFLTATILFLVVLILTSPWWFTVLGYHGLAPFVSAGNTGIHDIVKFFNLLLFDITAEAGLTTIGVFGLVGIFYCLAKKQFLFPVWLIATFLLAQRGEIVALLAGTTLASILAKIDQLEHRKKMDPDRVQPLSGFVSKAFLSILIIQWVYSMVTILNNESTVNSLLLSDVSAMTWVKENTSGDDEFLILSGLYPLMDAPSEWFPSLTGRRSIATVQGYEWVPGIDFIERLNHSLRLQECILQDLICIQEWEESSGWGYDYIYLRKFANAGGLGEVPSVGLSKSLLESTQFSLVYETDSVLILKLDESH